jgi:glutaredoxin
MITVYGADWCEDTRRTLRHLRRLHVPHEYLSVDENLDALKRASELNHGVRRTPTVDLGMGGSPLVEPANETLTAALVEMAMLTQDDVYERMSVQNVGDIERVVRTTAGAAILAAGSFAPRGARWPFGIVGLVVALTGLTGWCPAYHYTGASSLGGPGDRPDESERGEWLSRAGRPAHAGTAGSLS